MATTYKIIRGTKVEFGCSNASLPKTYGTLMSVSTDTQAQTVPIPNNDGAVVDLVIYDEQTAITLTCLFKADLGEGELPTNGGTVTVNGLTGIITGVKHDWSNAALRQLTITATVYHHLTQEQEQEAQND